MRFEWLLDRERQGQFKIYWKPGKTNLADYFTKHHPPSHHRNMRGEFLMRIAELQRLQQLPKEVGLAMTDGIFSKFLCKGVLIHTYQIRDTWKMVLNIRWRIFKSVKVF